MFTVNPMAETYVWVAIKAGGHATSPAYRLGRLITTDNNRNASTVPPVWA